MKLQDFIDETGIPVARLADRCSVTFHQIYHVLNGGTPMLRTVVSIGMYTKGRVTPEDLLPDDVLEELKLAFENGARTRKAG